MKPLAVLGVDEGMQMHHSADGCVCTSIDSMTGEKWCLTTKYSSAGELLAYERQEGGDKCRTHWLFNQCMSVYEQYLVYLIVSSVPHRSAKLSIPRKVSNNTLAL